MVRAEREQLCDLLELEPLTSEQAGELISAAVPPAQRERVVVAGGGNPFFLEQLSRAGGRTTRERVEPGSVDEGVPRAVLAALRGELEALDEGERALLGGGAVAGEPFEIDLAAAAAGIDREQAPWWRWTRCSPATWFARPTLRCASASATRSCAGPPTRPRARAGGWPRTRVPPRPCASAVPWPRRWPTT